VLPGDADCDDGSGGSGDCTPPRLAATCTEGLGSGDELAVDCGGPGSCLVGQACDDDSDCASGYCRCDRQVCASPLTVATGGLHTCLLFDDGAVHCWGQNDSGQLGYSHTANVGDNEAPETQGRVDVGGPVVQLAAGLQHTCALLEGGAVRCWGQNYDGQLGHGHTRHIGDDELPATAGDVPVGGRATQVGTGWYHTCAIMETGAARCWGFNHYGQLGYGYDHDIGDDEPASAAGDVPAGDLITDIMVGNDYTCALLSTAHVRCWGNNDYGQLGYGHTRHMGDDEPASAAGDVNVGGPVAQLGMGLGLHVCVLMTTGAVRCWGFNGYGQMGYGNTDTVGDNELPYTAGDVPCP
jgi:alpha-tubulin suppressor-like RCC1 family protein